MSMGKKTLELLGRATEDQSDTIAAVEFDGEEVGDAAHAWLDANEDV